MAGVRIDKTILPRQSISEHQGEDTWQEVVQTMGEHTGSQWLEYARLQIQDYVKTTI